MAYSLSLLTLKSLHRIAYVDHRWVLRCSRSLIFLWQKLAKNLRDRKWQDMRCTNLLKLPGRRKTYQQRSQAKEFLRTYNWNSWRILSSSVTALNFWLRVLCSALEKNFAPVPLAFVPSEKNFETFFNSDENGGLDFFASSISSLIFFVVSYQISSYGRSSFCCPLLCIT